MLVVLHAVCTRVVPMQLNAWGIVVEASCHEAGMLRLLASCLLVQDSPIIIMDEATSALDVKSERLVQQAVENLVTGRTVLVIAHRLSTVQVWAADCMKCPRSTADRYA